jgi:hypothetical protein
MTETELLRLRVLDWLLDYEPERPGEMPEIEKLVGAEDDLSPAEQAKWRNILRALRDDGLIELSESLGFNWGLWLTSRGRVDAEARRDRRQNPAARRAFARDALLAWLDGQPNHQAEDFGGFLASPGAYFEGFLLDTADVSLAAEYLYHRSLIAGVWTPQTGLSEPMLSPAGIDCIDHYGGSVSDYVRRNEGARTSNTLNIGSVSGSNLAVGNRDVAQNVETGEDLATLLRAIGDAIPLLGLAPDSETDLKDAVRQARTELAKPSPDQGWARSLLKRTGDILGKVTATALGPVLAAYMKHLATKHGIPMDD